MSDIQDDNIQIKLLQTVLVFISPQNIDLGSFDTIEKLLAISIQLYTSKNILVHNTISASVMQMITMIFDNFIQYIKTVKLDEKSEVDMQYVNNHTSLKCVKLFKDFIMISNGTKPDWISQPINIPKNFGLDILNSILKQAGSLMRYSKETHQTIKKDFIPSLSSIYENKNIDNIGCSDHLKIFILVIRILRATSRIIISLHDGLELMDHLISFINNSQSDVEKYLCLEAIHVTFEDFEILRLYNERHMTTLSYFSEMLNVFYKIANDINTNSDLTAKNYQVVPTKFSKIFEGSNADFDVPPINGCNIYKSLCSCFNMFTQSFLVLCEQYKITLGTKSSNIATNPERKNLLEFINSNWKSMIKTLKILLSRDVDESLTQLVLNTYQNLINLSGSLGMNQARDTYLMTLCQACVPNESASLQELNLKHIQTTKKLFNIAHCLGGILDVDSWQIILSTLQKTEIIFLKIRNEIHSTTPQKKKVAVTQSEQDKNAIKKLFNQEDELSISLDLQILSSALDSLFQFSVNYPIEYFRSFISALNKISLDYMEKMMADTLAAESINVDGKVRVFGLSRMLETTIVNLPRIELFWDLLYDHYLCISHSNNSVLRAQGVDNFNTVVEKILQYKSTIKKDSEKKIVESENKDLNSKIMEQWADGVWQKTLFQPWLDSSKSKFSDVKENICSFLLKLLQGHSYKIESDGWITICEVLYEISQDGGKASQQGFSCLDMIFTDYLHEIDTETVKSLVRVIENFKKITLDNNISYQALQMLWKIGDHLANLYMSDKKNEKENNDFEKTWTSILEKLLVYANDEHSELRTTAIHTITNLIVHHGSIIGDDLLTKVMDMYGLKLIDQVIENYIQASRVDTPQQPSKGQINPEQEERIKLMKLWMDTMLYLLQNIIKIFKKYVSIIEKKEGLNQNSQEVLVLKAVFARIKSIIMVSKGDLIIDSLKTFHEMILANPDVLSHVLDSIFETLQAIKSFLAEVRQDGKEIRLIISKFIPEILEILTEIFEPERYKALNPSKTPYAKYLFEMIEKMIQYSRQTETFNSISPQKILTDIKVVYEFLEKSPATLCKNSDDMCVEYFKFMNRVMESNVADKFSDTILRKCINILQVNIINGNFDLKTYQPFMPAIFENLNGILSLRANNDFLTLAINNSKNTIPIWLFATDYFINLVHQMFKIIRFKILEAKENNTELDADFNQFKNKILGVILDIYDNVLRCGEKSIETISKGVLSEMKKDWFEMDMKFINSISEVIFPNFFLLSQDKLWKLIQILDFVFTFYSKSPFFTEQSATYGRDLSTNTAISKITLEILFRISDTNEEESKNSDDMKDLETKLHLSRLSTKKLLKKCYALIEKYLYDEERSGSMPLPRNRILEICYILEKLKKLKIPKDSFRILDKHEALHKLPSKEINSDQLPDELDEASFTTVYTDKKNNIALLQGQKGHLIYLMPILSRCITCRDPELKELLKDTFVEISKEMGIE